MRDDSPQEEDRGATYGREWAEDNRRAAAAFDNYLLWGLGAVSDNDRALLAAHCDGYLVGYKAEWAAKAADDGVPGAPGRRITTTDPRKGGY